MRITPQFPERLLQDPDFKAQFEAHTELANSSLPGVTLYHLPGGPHPLGLNFTTWIEGTSRFGLRIVPGEFCIQDGKWMRLTADDRAKRVMDPVRATWDASEIARHAISETTGQGTFLIPVVVFADMPVDEDIVRASSSSSARILWGLESLADRLVDLVNKDDVVPGLSADRIQRELRAFDPEFNWDEPAEVAPPVELAAGQVIIQHVDVVNVYTLGTEGACLPQGQQPLRSSVSDR